MSEETSIIGSGTQQIDLAAFLRRGRRYIEEHSHVVGAAGGEVISPAALERYIAGQLPDIDLSRANMTVPARSLLDALGHLAAELAEGRQEGLVGGPDYELNRLLHDAIVEALGHSGVAPLSITFATQADINQMILPPPKGGGWTGLHAEPKQKDEPWRDKVRPAKKSNFTQEEATYYTAYYEASEQYEALWEKFAKACPHSMKDPIQLLTGGDSDAPFRAYPHEDFHDEMQKVLEKAREHKLVPPVNSTDAGEKRMDLLVQIAETHGELCDLRDKINSLKPKRGRD